MKRSPIPSIVIDPVRESLISSSGALLLRETIRTCDLDRRLSQALSPWRPRRARHDPSKVVLDIATALALGGDCLADWPEGMRVIARRERPHPGAQLRLTDHNGWRITCFATNTRGPGWRLPTLEVRHRQRARCEDRIRCLKDTGLANLPLYGFGQNQIWVEIVALAGDLLAWMQTLAFDNAAPARRWEPKRLRFRLLAVAGRIIRTGRRRLLRLPRGWPWEWLIEAGWTTLRTV